MKENAEKKEKKPFGTGTVVFLSFLCVILVIAAAAALLGCVMAGSLVQRDDLALAGSSIALEQVTCADGTSLPAYINRTYLMDERISDDKLSNILRDGTFTQWVGEKTEMYAASIAAGNTFPPQIQPDEVAQLLERNDSTIQLHTGIHDYSQENPRTIERIKPDIAAWNGRMNDLLGNTLSGGLVRASVSLWIVWVLCVVLGFALILLVLIHARGQRRLGTAFKTFAAAAFVPSAVLFLAGLLGKWLLGMTQLSAFSKRSAAAPAWCASRCLPLASSGTASPRAAPLWQTVPPPR